MAFRKSLKAGSVLVCAAVLSEKGNTLYQAHDDLNGLHHEECMNHVSGGIQ
jgi:hypothetical protein